ncbi:MAG: alpha/beta hydrolase [Polyangiaceae bacterium]
MNSLFFGDSSRQLFGAYHAPSPSVPVRGAALLCAPWGPEYFISHRVIRRIATRLSESGYHALRFDYFGTGDSAGEREDGDLASWYADASLAVDELRDMSGFESVTSIGIRLGAVIGWRLAQRRDDVSSVLMWDPVIDGAQYVRELIDAQLEINRWSLAWRKPCTSGRRVLDLLGYPLTPTMRASVEAVRKDEFAQPTKAGITLFQSNSSPDRLQLARALHAASARVRFEPVAGQTSWLETDAFSAGGLPYATVERMVELVP